MIKWLLALALVCSVYENQQGVMFRIANRSEFELQNVIVKFPSQTEEYGNIPPMGITNYRQISKAYRYAYVHALIDGNEAVLQPEDYVGEELLKPGRYTYAFTYNPTAKDKYSRLRLEFERE